jgi:hypothetical protein
LSAKVGGPQDLLGGKGNARHYIICVEFGKANRSRITLPKIWLIFNESKSRMMQLVGQVDYFLSVERVESATNAQQLVQKLQIKLVKNSLLLHYRDIMHPQNSQESKGNCTPEVLWLGMCKASLNPIGYRWHG